MIVFKPILDEETTEDLAEVSVVGLLLESKRARVFKVDGELVG